MNFMYEYACTLRSLPRVARPNPIFLRAVLYIANSRDLRDTNPYLSEEVAKSGVTMIKICNSAAAGNRFCLFSSKDGSHFLAASKETGPLVSIRHNSAR